QPPPPRSTLFPYRRSSDLPIISWASNGYIQPMDRYAKAVGVKKSDYFPVAWDMINIGGHIWGLMQEFDFQQFAWNKNIHKRPPPDRKSTRLNSSHSQISYA